MEHFHSSLSLGFKDQYRGWAGVELGRRALFIFLVVLFPREKVIDFCYCKIQENNADVNYLNRLLSCCFSVLFLLCMVSANLMRA